MNMKTFGTAAFIYAIGLVIGAKIGWNTRKWKYEIEAQDSGKTSLSFEMGRLTGYYEGLVKAKEAEKEKKEDKSE